jgi:plasmid stabilization system protein ParE
LLDRAAANDLERIADYLLAHAPARAPEVVRAIYAAASDLLRFPNLGRPGGKQGTRELVLTPLPYLIVYCTRGDVIHIVRILHGAQRWP